MTKWIVAGIFAVAVLVFYGTLIVRALLGY